MTIIVIFIFCLWLAKKLTDWQEKEGFLDSVEESLKKSKLIRSTVLIIIDLMILFGVGMVGGINLFTTILILILWGIVYSYIRSLK